MLAINGMLARRVFGNFVRNHGHRTSMPGDNLPFDISNKYKLTAMFTLYFGSGFIAPFFVLIWQMVKHK